MELIYTDANKKDIGVIKPLSFDLAFGVDENDFELVITKSSHCCEAGSVIYIDGEEYGGIVDDFELSTAAETIKYIGRTFHGVLNSKVFQPEAGTDYITLYGDANRVLEECIELLDLSDLFVASQNQSGIIITAYEMDRYIKGYDGIRKMLNSAGAKLKMKWIGRHIQLSAEMLIDYSISDEFMLSTVTNMSIKKHFNAVNHIIGLGKGDLSERKVIHLFTDENGGIMPYATVDNPIKDSDYILDKRNQQLFGKDEVCDTYDLSNAETVENYVLTSSQPKDWAQSFADYFVLTDEEKYEQIKPDTENIYTLQTAKPSDWDNSFSNYFTKSDGEYSTVQGVEKENYSKLTSQPKDWSKNYGNYCYFYTDGVSSEYKSVSGVSKISYKKQTRKPSDWNTGYKSYFVKDKSGSYVSVSSFENWKANKFYTRYSVTVAPKFESNKYYRKTVTTTVPVWKSNTYYTQSAKNIKPAWKSNTYYKQYTDDYASVVKGCIEKLENAWNSDDIDFNFDISKRYDIGDIVGAVESVTGIFAARQITKKIVKIKSNGDLEISYEEGVTL